MAVHAQRDQIVRHDEQVWSLSWGKKMVNQRRAVPTLHTVVQSLTDRIVRQHQVTRFEPANGVIQPVDCVAYTASVPTHSRVVLVRGAES